MLRRIIGTSGELRDFKKFLPNGDAAGYSSVVIEYLVPHDQRWAFRRWHGRLVHTAELSEGFIRADRHRPLHCKSGVLKWYSVIHFDRPEHLNGWLSSKSREQVLEAGRDIFKSYKFKSFATGLEGWFSHQSGTELDSLGPPAWKQILSVVLGLYPIIMVQDFVFQRLDLFDDWPPARAMLANNMITTCILTLVVMPLIVRLLDFWLQPAHQRASLRAEVVGAIFTILAMGIMVFVFDGTLALL
jgi:antibiotic biosynthesis monooxygenase (ABM) superfamily enzyme